MQIPLSSYLFRMGWNISDLFQFFSLSPVLTGNMGLLPIEMLGLQVILSTQVPQLKCFHSSVWSVFCRSTMKIWLLMHCFADFNLTPPDSDSRRRRHQFGMRNRLSRNHYAPYPHQFSQYKHNSQYYWLLRWCKILKDLRWYADHFLKMMRLILAICIAAVMKIKHLHINLDYAAMLCKKLRINTEILQLYFSATVGLLCLTLNGTSQEYYEAKWIVNGGIKLKQDKVCLGVSLGRGPLLWGCELVPVTGCTEW